MLQTIRKFVIDNYLFGEEGTLKDEDSFMETGIIGSTGILELVRFLESTYTIKVTDEDLIPDNLDSVSKIQGRLFAQAVQPTGIIVTKLDDSARGGAIVALRKELGMPIRFLGLGETVDDLRPFDPARYAARLLEDGPDM